jgi:hypothetical protein
MHVRPVVVGGPPEAQEMVPKEVGPDQDDITIAIDGTTYIWTRGEPIDGGGPVPVQYFGLMAVVQYRDAEALARLDDRIAHLDTEIDRLDREIERLDDVLDDPSNKPGPHSD